MPLISAWHRVVHVDDGGAAPPNTDDGYYVAMAAVNGDFFDHFVMPPIAGRLFSASDYVGPTRVAIVNQLFVEQVFGGRNPIGRRVKLAEGEPWLEIVGLVRNVAMGFPGQQRKEGLYIPLDLRRSDSVMVSARVPGAGPAGLTSQAFALRALAATTDPMLRVTDVRSLEDEVAISVGETGIFVKVLSVVSGWVMLLALSGIYAVMSFAVSRRTREIGIRMALGSSRARVVLAILQRPIRQIVAGVIVGTVVGLAFQRFVSEGKPPENPWGLSGFLALIVASCVLASLAPVRRALKVDPIAALRND
jgi:hypothetical protein